MTNAELIKALRYCISDEYVEKGCLICPICAPRQGEMKCNSQDDAIKYAADALEAAEQRIAGLEKSYSWKAYAALEESIEGYKVRIAELEAQMPKEGKWTTKRTWEHDGEIYCSVCNHDAPTEGDYRQVKMNYCPNCGARMQTVTNCHTLEEGER